MKDNNNNTEKKTFWEKLANLPVFNWLKTGLDNEGLQKRQNIKKKIDTNKYSHESHLPEAMEEQHNQEPKEKTSHEEQPHRSQEKEDKEN